MNSIQKVFVCFVVFGLLLSCGVGLAYGINTSMTASRTSLNVGVTNTFRGTATYDTRILGIPTTKTAVFGKWIARNQYRRPSISYREGLPLKTFVSGTDPILNQSAWEYIHTFSVKGVVRVTLDSRAEAYYPCTRESTTAAGGFNNPHSSHITTTVVGSLPPGGGGDPTPLSWTLLID